MDGYDPQLALGYPEPDAWEPQRGGSFSAASEAVLAGFIWLPSLLLAASLYYADAKMLAAGAVALAALLHLAFRPFVAVLVLVFLIYMDWAVHILPGVTSPGKLFGLFALVVSLPRIAAAVRQPKWDPLVPWLVVFLLYGLLVTPMASHPAFAALRWLTLPLVFGQILLVAVQVTTWRRLNVLLVVIVLCSLLTTGLLIQGGQAVRNIETVERETLTSELATTIANINEIATRLGLGVAAALYLFLRRRGLLWKLAMTASILIISVGVLATKSRSVLAAILLAVMVAIMFSKLALSRRIGLVAAILVLSIIGYVALTGAGIGFGGVMRHMQQGFEEGSESGGRLIYWRGYINAFLASGMLGNGFKFAQFTRAYRETAGLPRVAHNDFFQILGDLGLVGVITFVGIHLHIYRRIRRADLPWERVCAVLLIGILVGSGFAHSFFYNRHYGLGLGVVVAILHLCERQREHMAWDAQAQT